MVDDKSHSSGLAKRTNCHGTGGRSAPTHRCEPTKAHNATGSTRSAKRTSKHPHARGYIQDGHHISFHCPLHQLQQPRRSLIGARDGDNWEAPGRALLIKNKEEGREHYVDGADPELFFEYILAQLT